MRVKLFSRAFLSKIGALVLLLSLFFVPLVVQSTSAAFTSSATAKTTVSAYASWDPSNVSVVAEPKENVSTVKGPRPYYSINQISLSYTPQLTFSFREPEYISPGSDTYRVRVYNSGGGIAHQEWKLGGSPGATISIDLSSYLNLWAGNTYGFSVRNSLINGSDFIRKDVEVSLFPTKASNHAVVLAGAGLIGAGTKITITAPPGTTISNVTWPTHNGGEVGTKTTDTSTKKVWSFPHLNTCNVNAYSNITPMKYRFYYSATGTYGPYNQINIYSCGTSI